MLNSMIDFMIGAQANPNRLGMGITMSIMGHEICYGIITHPALPLTQQFNLILFP